MDGAGRGDDIMTAGRPHWIVTVGSVAAALSGLFVALAGMQLLGARFYEGWMNLAAYAFIGVGFPMIPGALMTYRGRFPAAVFTLLLGVTAFLVMGAWCVVTCGSVFSLMNLMAIPLSACATLLIGLGLPKVRDMAEAKKRLADEGLSLGL